MGVYLGSDPISLYLGGQGKEAEDINPELTEQETIIQNITEALVGKVYGANATPETILKGYSAYVHQELVEGTYEPMSGIDFGYIDLTQTQDTITVNHNLGVTPRTVLLAGNMLRADVITYYISMIFQSKDGYQTGTISPIYGTILRRNGFQGADTATKFADYDESTIVFKQYTFGSDKYQYPSGSRYLWFALA